MNKVRHWERGRPRLHRLCSTRRGAEKNTAQNIIRAARSMRGAGARAPSIWYVTILRDFICARGLTSHSGFVDLLRGGLAAGFAGVGVGDGSAFGDGVGRGGMSALAKRGSNSSRIAN